MTNTVRLPLSSPIAIQGTEEGFWLADRDSRLLVCFAAADAKQIREILLPETPVALAAADDFVAAGLASGDVVAFHAETGAQVWRRSVGLGPIQLTGGPEHIWAVERDGDVIVSFDRTGADSRVQADHVRNFAALPDGVAWLSGGGVLAAQNVLESAPRILHLPDGATTGGMAACSNAIWVSVEKALLLIDQYEFQLRTTLVAPEGPVPHLICADGKLVGGLNGVFVMNPMTDARLHPLPVQPSSQLSGLAANSEWVWALESALPLVHMTQLL